MVAVSRRAAGDERKDPGGPAWLRGRPPPTRPEPPAAPLL